MIFDREVMGLRPTQGDEKRLLFSNYCSLEAPPSPLSSRPERRAVERSAVSGPFVEMFFDRAGEKCGLGRLKGMAFRPYVINLESVRL